MRNPVRWDEPVDGAWVESLVDGFGGRPESLVGIFGAIQERYAYLPERALRIVSDRMSIHWAQVFGAAGMGGFRLLPTEGHLVTVCTCAACHFAGGDALLAAFERRLGIRPGETTDDGRFSLETATDVGAGALAPAVRIDTLVYGPIHADHADHLIDERRAAAAAVTA
jgi:NADH:ubiquinone oxidoreductase subunit E